MVDTPEEVIVLLMRHLDGHLPALLHHLLLAVGPLHGAALRAALDGAHGAALLVTLLPPAGHLILLHHGLKVGLGGVVIAFVHLDLLLDLLVHQLAVLPGDVFAVFVGGELLLSVLVDFPLGVALLLGDLLTVGRLLDLSQYLDSIFPAFFRSEGLLLGGVAPHVLLLLVGVAGVARHHGALCLGDLHTDLLRPGSAFPYHLEAAYLVCSCLVGELES